MYEISQLTLIGYGAIGQALTPLLISQFGLTPDAITAIDPTEEGELVAREYGIQFHRQAITRKNIFSTLERLVRPGGLLINVSVDVSSIDLIRWCQSRQTLYIDTCVEPWAGNYGVGSHKAPTITNYELRQQVLALRHAGGSTAVVAHGANPGLVTHFVKQALLDLAARQDVREWRSWPDLAQQLKVRCIQIAERDTQVADAAAIACYQFVNTWSVDGLISEAWQRAELGWGTHERNLPAGAMQHRSGDRAGIYLATRGAETRVKSWVPTSGAQTAFLITHHEALSIASWLTLHDDDGKAIYRPTSYYAYCPSPDTQQSLQRWVEAGYPAVGTQRVLRDELSGGYDELGVLLVFDGGSYWYGSTLDLHDARALASGNNATTLQVVAGILGAVRWMQLNPRRGLVEAEDMDHEVVLRVAAPLLGKMHGAFSEWQPAANGKLQFADFVVDDTRNYRSLNIRARARSR